MHQEDYAKQFGRVIT